MTSISIVAPQRRIPRSSMAGILAVAFALGALTGFGLPRILDRTNAVSATVGAPAIEGTAARDMSGAAYQAIHPTTVVAPGSTMAGRTMSDAAYDALHGQAGRTMSDAAYDALHASSLAP